MISTINNNFQNLRAVQTILNNSLILSQMQETLYIKHLSDEFHRINYDSFASLCKELFIESCVRILRDKHLKRKQEESNSEYVKYIILVVPRSY